MILKFISMEFVWFFIYTKKFVYGIGSYSISHIGQKTKIKLVVRVHKRAFHASGLGGLSGQKGPTKRARRRRSEITNNF